jgi:hypothetical protein
MPGTVTGRVARIRDWPRRRRAALGAGVVVALVLAGALGYALWSDDSGGPSGYPTGLVPGAQAPPTASTSATRPGGTTPAPPGGSARPGVTGGSDPSSQAATGFLAELGAIDPVLTTDPAGALAGGRTICADLAAHQPDETVLGNATKRFHLGPAAADRAKAALIVDAAHNHLCP